MAYFVYFWANFNWCKWPNFENNLAIWSHWTWDDGIKKTRQQPRKREPWSSDYGRRLVFQRSWVWILSLYTGWTWHFYTLICCKNCNNVCLKRPKINEKEAGVGPFKKEHYTKRGWYSNLVLSRNNKFTQGQLESVTVTIIGTINGFKSHSKSATPLILSLWNFISLHDFLYKLGPSKCWHEPF